jgi:hypothetical protein
MMIEEKDPKDEKKPKRFQTRDWIIIALAHAVFFLMVGYARTNTANTELELQNQRLENDLQLIGVLVSTYIETRQSEAEVNDRLCEEKLNRGYLEFYEKLKLRSDSIKHFRNSLSEVILEKQDQISRRNEKAASYNTYAQSLDWETYGNGLYNLPQNIEMMK